MRKRDRGIKMMALKSIFDGLFFNEGQIELAFKKRMDYRETKKFFFS